MKRRKIVELFEKDMHELDDLVSSELLALEKQTLERMKSRKEVVRELGAEEKRSKDTPKAQKTRRIQREGEEYVYPEAEVTPFFEVDVNTENDLFDESEEKFISAAVTYLRAKENKDSIISRIWNQLTEAEPDAFYTPDEEDSDKESDDGDGENPSNTGEPV